MRIESETGYRPQLEIDELLRIPGGRDADLGSFGLQILQENFTIEQRLAVLEEHREEIAQLVKNASSTNPGVIRWFEGVVDNLRYADIEFNKQAKVIKAPPFQVRPAGLYSPQFGYLKVFAIDRVRKLTPDAFDPFEAATLKWAEEKAIRKPGIQVIYCMTCPPNKDVRFFNILTRFSENPDLVDSTSYRIGKFDAQKAQELLSFLAQEKGGRELVTQEIIDENGQKQTISLLVVNNEKAFVKGEEEIDTAKEFLRKVNQSQLPKTEFLLFNPELVKPFFPYPFPSWPRVEASSFEEQNEPILCLSHQSESQRVNISVPVWPTPFQPERTEVSLLGVNWDYSPLDLLVTTRAKIKTEPEFFTTPEKITPLPTLFQRKMKEFQKDIPQPQLATAKFPDSYPTSISLTDHSSPKRQVRTNQTASVTKRTTKVLSKDAEMISSDNSAQLQIFPFKEIPEQIFVSQTPPLFIEDTNGHEATKAPTKPQKKVISAENSTLIEKDDAESKRDQKIEIDPAPRLTVRPLLELETETSVNQTPSLFETNTALLEAFAIEPEKDTLCKARAVVKRLESSRREKSEELLIFLTQTEFKKNTTNKERRLVFLCCPIWVSKSRAIDAWTLADLDLAKFRKALTRPLFTKTRVFNRYEQGKVRLLSTLLFHSLLNGYHLNQGPCLKQTISGGLSPIPQSQVIFDRRWSPKVVYEAKDSIPIITLEDSYLDVPKNDIILPFPERKVIKADDYQEVFTLEELLESEAIWAVQSKLNFQDFKFLFLS